MVQNSRGAVRLRCWWSSLCGLVQCACHVTRLLRRSCKFITELYREKIDQNKKILSFILHVPHHPAASSFDEASLRQPDLKWQAYSSTMAACMCAVVNKVGDVISWWWRGKRGDRNSAQRQLSVTASFPPTHVGARHCSRAAPISAHLFIIHQQTHTHACAPTYMH